MKDRTRIHSVRTMAVAGLAVLLGTAGCKVACHKDGYDPRCSATYPRFHSSCPVVGCTPLSGLHPVYSGTGCACCF